MNGHVEGNDGVWAGRENPEFALVTPAKMKSVYESISSANGVGIPGSFGNVVSGSELCMSRVSSKVELDGSNIASSERPVPNPIGTAITDPVSFVTIDCAWPCSRIPGIEAAKRKRAAR